MFILWLLNINFFVYFLLAVYSWHGRNFYSVVGSSRININFSKENNAPNAYVVFLSIPFLFFVLFRYSTIEKKAIRESSIRLSFKIISVWNSRTLWLFWMENRCCKSVNSELQISSSYQMTLSVSSIIIK